MGQLQLFWDDGFSSLWTEVYAKHRSSFKNQGESIVTCSSGYTMSREVSIEL
jgi:hypothetical protein